MDSTPLDAPVPTPASAAPPAPPAPPTPARRSRFRVRSLVSVFIGCAALVLALTGATLFIVPPGRIANWGGWTFLGLAKSRWQALHVVFAALFTILSILHLVYNWRPLVSYFRSRPRRRFAPEWIVALLLAGGVALATLQDLPPFSTLMEAQESLKRSWDTPRNQGPVPHAELLSLEEVSREAGLELPLAIERLEARGIAAAATDRFGDLATKAGLSPEALYRVVTGESSGGPEGGRRGEGRGGGGAGGGSGRGGAGKGRGFGQGSPSHLPEGAGEGASVDPSVPTTEVREPQRGFGRMTLEDLCSSEGLAPDGVLETLRASGIEAKGDTSVRDLAGKLGVSPREVPARLRGNAVEREPAPEPKAAAPTP